MNYCEGAAHGLAAAFTGYYHVNALTVSSSQPHVDINGRGSGYRLSASTQTSTSYVLPNTNDRWMHIAWKHAGSTQTLLVASFRRGGTTQLSIEVNGSGYLVVRRGAYGSGTVLTNTVANPPIVAVGVWNWFWIEYIADTVAGRVRIYQNGVTSPVYDTSVTNTANAGVAGWDQFAWVTDGGGFSPIWGDLVTFTDAEKTAIFGATFPELYIPAVVPTGIDTNTFVSGTFTDVDEIPWSTADYAAANAIGQELILSNTGLSYTPPSVYAVANTWYMERDGSITTTQSRFKSGAANVTGSAVAGIGSAQYTERQEFFPYNPDGSIVWTWGAVTSSKFGTKTV